MRIKKIKYIQYKNGKRRTLLVVQWLRFHASNAGHAGAVPGWGPKIRHAFGVWPKEKENSFSADTIAFWWLQNRSLVM